MVWGSSALSVCFQEPADSSLSRLIAEKPGPRTAFLARRPQGNESYREDVRKIVAASKVAPPVSRSQTDRMPSLRKPHFGGLPRVGTGPGAKKGLTGLVPKGLAPPKGGMLPRLRSGTTVYL